MCVDAMAMQWFMDAMAKKEKPTNSAPGLAYMLCGATQHSNTDAMDKASPAIPIGPHWMIMWPFNANRVVCPRRCVTRVLGSCLTTHRMRTSTSAVRPG